MLNKRRRNEVILLGIILSLLPSSTLAMFEFTRPYYNASVPEISVGSYSLAEGGPYMMGMWSIEATQGVQYSIVRGGLDYRVNAVEMGDFIFMRLETRILTRDSDVVVRALSADRSQETFCSVYISVVFENDPPLFPLSRQDVKIREDTPLGSNITVVRADDMDTDAINSRIYYSLPDNTNNFAVHPITGNVFLTSSLRHDVQSVHSINIAASDRNCPSVNSLSLSLCQKKK